MRREPDRLERFVREARTASALNHPHICTIHALGEHQGRPFIVMEFIEGYTLRALAFRQPPIDEVIRIARQAARALAAAHAAGVVHRDIKPENVMVREDGYVKVLDFGLARQLPALTQSNEPADHDTKPGALLGTVAYMSPEQAAGTTIDSSSDVFSLGIVLYQLVTGQHPFAADSPLNMLHAISNSEPVPPSRINPLIPANIDGLILAMLQKDRGLRPTAVEVQATLAAIRGSPGPTVANDSNIRPIVHREPELGALRTAFAAPAAGIARSSALPVNRELGRRRSSRTFSASYQASRPASSRGQCSQRLTNTEAYLPVIHALENLLRSDSSGSVARLMKAVAPTWAAQLTRAKADSIAAETVSTSQALSQQGMLREFCNLLRDTSRVLPIVLFFDDVHWADVPTVDLLDYLGHNAQGLRVLLVVTFRQTELLVGSHPFHRVKLELQAKGRCTELSLGFLGRDDIGSYLALAFPANGFPTDFADAIYSRTEGNPLFMADLLTYLRERGVIAQTDGQWRLAKRLPELRAELPESVRSMIQRKLERLDDYDRRLLAAASVQGHQFDSAVIAGALKLEPAEVEEHLQALDYVHGLVRSMHEFELPDRTLSIRFAFVHILYQQTLYDSLSPSRQRATRWPSRKQPRTSPRHKRHRAGRRAGMPL